MKQDFLIIGQGLAGSLLAHSLIEHEQNVTIVDNASPQSASRIAAGIINPLTGQRMVVAADTRHCLPAAIDSYEKLANQFKQQFFIAKPMLRMFKDASEKDRYRSRAGDENYADFLGDEFVSGSSGEPINDSLGGFRQTNTGYLNIQLLLDCLQQHFKQQASYIASQFDYRELELENDIVKWRGRRFDHVVFCEGAGAINNLWFRWLPFQLSKGELLNVVTENELPEGIINSGHWVLPVGQHQAKIGASYSWNWTNESPTLQARQELTTSAEKILTRSGSITVTEHRSGIRPTTRDKQPFIGTHPSLKQLHCFNGFGSRGGMLIPYYVRRLIENLLAAIPLPLTVDIRRFQETESLLVIARRYLSENIETGDVVIDATLGNGHDAELAARCVGEQGHVYGFDMQQQAILNTQQRLLQARVNERVSLIKEDHANMKCHLNGALQEKVSVVVFNLGFLPGADKNCTTTVDSTLKALNDATLFLKPGGLIIVMTYSGHKCGKNETESVIHWCNELDKTKFTWRMLDAKQKNEAPMLLVITKSKN